MSTPAIAPEQLIASIRKAQIESSCENQKPFVAFVLRGKSYVGPLPTDDTFCAFNLTNAQEVRVGGRKVLLVPFQSGVDTDHWKVYAFYESPVLYAGQILGYGSKGITPVQGYPGTTNEVDGDTLNVKARDYVAGDHLCCPSGAWYVVSSWHAGESGLTLVPAPPACKQPNQEAVVTHAVTPQWPLDMRGKGSGSARIVVIVVIGPGGLVERERVYQSSHYYQLDQAVMDAAKSSTYSPEISNCRPTEGAYAFGAEFNYP